MKSQGSQRHPPAPPPPIPYPHPQSRFCLLALAPGDPSMHFLVSQVIGRYDVTALQPQAFYNIDTPTCIQIIVEIIAQNTMKCNV